MNKVLSLAYFAGGSKFTLEPFIALKNSRHDLKAVFTKSPKRAGRGKKKTHNLLLDKAVEFGMPLARVANTGISAYVSPYGEIIGKISLYNEGFETFYSVPALNNTLYKICGEYIFIVLILILLVINTTYNFTKGKRLNEK